MFQDSEQRGFDRRADRLFGWIFNQRRFALSLTAVVFAVALFSVRGISFSENITELLPQDDLVVSNFQGLANRFELMDHVYFEVGPGDSQVDVAQGELVAMADALHRELVDSGHFKQIMYRWDPGEMNLALQQLLSTRASLFTKGDAEVLADALAQDAILDGLEEWKKALVESPAPFMSRELYADPLNINRIFVEKLSGLRSSDSAIVVRDGRLFSSDGRHVLLMALAKSRATDSLRAEALIGSLDECIGRVESRDPEGRVRVSYFSGHRASLENAQQIKADIQTTVTLSIVAIAFFSLMVYRRWWLMPLTFAPVLFGASFALIFVRWFDPVISAIAIGCGSMLIGISVDYAVHVLYSADQSIDGKEVREQLLRIMRRLLAPILLSASTTFSAFCVLHFSIMPGYRGLGHFAAPGILAAVLFSIAVLPMLIIKPLAGAGRRPLWRLTEWFEPLIASTTKRRTWSLLVLVSISIVALIGVPKIGFEGDIRKLNAMSPETRQALSNIVSRFGDMMSSTSLAVVGVDLEEALQRNEDLAALLQTHSDEDLRVIGSVSGVLPSERVQVENRRRWTAFWDDARLTQLRDNFASACQTLRMRPQAFAEFFDSLPGDTHPVRYEAYLQGPLGDMLSRYVSTTSDGAAILTRVALKDRDTFAALEDELQSKIPQTLTYDGAFFAQHVVELIYQEMIRLGGISLGLITLILIVFVRRIKLVAAILAPLFLSMLWTFGCLALLGISFNVMNSVVAVFVFGLIVDYSVFLTLALRRSHEANRQEVLQTSAAITISALTTMCGMGALVFARHPALHSIGATAVLAIASGLVAVFTVVPLLSTRIAADGDSTADTGSA